MKTVREWIQIWNDKYAELTKEGHSADVHNSLMADWCESILLEAKQKYYETGDTIMDDQTYDHYEDNLKIIRPNSKFLDKVGYTIKEK